MVGSFDPDDLVDGRIQLNGLHQLGSAELVVGATQLPSRSFDLRQVSVSQLLGLTRRMKWVAEQEQTVCSLLVCFDH